MKIRQRNNCICLLLLLGILTSCIGAVCQTGAVAVPSASADVLHSTITSHEIAPIETICTDELLGRQSAIQSIRRGSSDSETFRSRIEFRLPNAAFFRFSETGSGLIWILLVDPIILSAVVIIRYIQRTDGKKPMHSFYIA